MLFELIIVSEVLLFLYLITVCIIFNDKHGMELILSCWMLVCWRLVVLVGLFAFVISGVFPLLLFSALLSFPGSSSVFVL